MREREKGEKNGERIGRMMSRMMEKNEICLCSLIGKIAEYDDQWSLSIDDTSNWGCNSLKCVWSRVNAAY